MFRLGTRPESSRTSWPLEASTSSFSPDRVETELGTSLMFSARRSAVTVTGCSVPAAALALAAGEATCAITAGQHSASEGAIAKPTRKRLANVC